MLVSDNKPLVSVITLVYNHENYLRDYFNGILIQKTNFKFEVLIHDDASTDNSARIIKEYVDKYPDVFIPIFQTENQHSQGVHICDTFLYPKAKGKYIALCEGDDYWIDPLKLQKQVDYMEVHDKCSMTCSDAKVVSPDGELDWRRIAYSGLLTLEDIVLNGGLYINTVSILFRGDIIRDAPSFMCNCHVGDYPLQIFMALKGTVFYFCEKMAVYRFKMGNSWTAKNSSENVDSLLPGVKSEVDMLKNFDVYSGYKYHSVFLQRIYNYIYFFSIMHYNERNRIWGVLSSYKKECHSFYSKKMLFLDFLMKIRLFRIYLVLQRIKSRFS